MPHDFGRFQGTAMAEVEAFRAALHHAVQFASNRLRVVFERWPDGAAGERNSADQNSRRNQVADQRIVRWQFNRYRAGSMPTRVTNTPVDSKVRKVHRVTIAHQDIRLEPFIRLMRQRRFEKEPADPTCRAERHRLLSIVKIGVRLDAPGSGLPTIGAGRAALPGMIGVGVRDDDQLDVLKGQAMLGEYPFNLAL